MEQPRGAFSRLFSDTIEDRLNSRSPTTSNSSNEVQVPGKIKNALEVVLGENVDSVEIIENNWHLKITGTYATTRIDTIYLRCSVEEFFTYNFTVLEEYYHVVKQWHAGAMTRYSYMLRISKMVMTITDMRSRQKLLPEIIYKDTGLSSIKINLYDHLIMKWFIPYITVIFLFGCVPIGDNLLVIKGNIEDFNSTENHSCLLTLYNGDNSTVIYQIGVTEDIDIDYTIEPKKRRYKLSIDCTNDIQKTIYDSGIIYLGDKPKDVIELGSLRITK